MSKTTSTFIDCILIILGLIGFVGWGYLNYGFLGALAGLGVFLGIGCIAFFASILWHLRKSRGVS